MAFNKRELLSLPPEEKVALAEELWSSVEDEMLPVTEEDVDFAERRLKLHRDNPGEGVGLEELKEYFSKKYGF